MTTTDKMTDDYLEYLSEAKAQPVTSSMARELLAHRRASQAAPAPVAWQHVAASIQAHQIADDVVSGRLDRLTAFVPYTALKAAPAPSDGLREALERLRMPSVDYGFALAHFHDGWNEALDAVIAALSAPAQEGAE